MQPRETRSECQPEYGYASHSPLPLSSQQATVPSAAPGTSSPGCMPRRAHISLNIRWFATFEAGTRAQCGAGENCFARCNEKILDCQKRIRCGHSGSHTREQGEEWASREPGAGRSFPSCSFLPLVIYRRPDGVPLRQASLEEKELKRLPTRRVRAVPIWPSLLLAQPTKTKWL